MAIAGRPDATLGQAPQVGAKRAVARRIITAA